jgi:hypothetical protein
MRSFFGLAVIAALLVCGAVGIDAQAAEPNAEIQTLFEQLRGNDFDAREAATEALMRRSDVTDQTLATALRKSSGEERHRLTNVAMHLFFERLSESHELPIPNAVERSGQAEAVGAIGIDTPDTNLLLADQHPELTHAGWLITGTRPGFPGFVYLRPGDIITGLEGQPFTDDLDREYFIDMITQYRNNQTMKLNVLRRGKRIEVVMVISAKSRLMFVAEQLQASGDQRPQMYGPWREHLKGLLGEGELKPQIVIGTPEGPPGV